MRTHARPHSLILALVALLCFAATPAFATATHLDVTEAIADPMWSMFSGGHAFWLRGLFEDPGDESPAERKYVFDGTPMFSIEDNNTAVVTDDTIDFTGSIVNMVDSDLTFDFEVDFTRLDPADPPSIPDGTPKRELFPGAYADVDPFGPGIVPSSWSLWLLNSGSLTGTGALAGGILELEHRRMNGDLAPAFMLGVGASGKNLAPGFSGWLGWSAEDQPDNPELEFRWDGRGDININHTNRSAPIPGTIALLALGITGGVMARRRKRRAP